ncbi:hypothetical protein V500_01848 [Pseudogymnoascus sp. VKM F-4518 (FW-2643)]|nr:hypothetical protein V500_01848 [Pseudogymnoascus sp. VKM F-4518 (FW-2643)]
MILQRILSERVLSTKEIYWNALYNKAAFEKTWNENPRTIRILKGPRCLLSLTPVNPTAQTPPPPTPTLDLYAPTQSPADGQWDLSQEIQ